MALKLDNDVEITLDGETHLLRPSLKATTAISRAHGGLVGAVQGCLNGELDVYQSVIKAGIVTAKNISTDDLREMVWRAGMNKLSMPVGKFIRTLQNGGKDPDAEDDEDETTPSEEGNDREG